MAFRAASDFLAALAAPASPTPEDLRPIVGLQDVDLNRGYIWLIVAAVSLLLAALVAWCAFIRRKRPRSAVTSLTPREAALRRLAALEAKLEKFDARAFGLEIGDVLRTYIGDEYRLQPDRQTSGEFLSSIAVSRVFSPQEHALLSDFMAGCDLLKFARADATLPAKLEMLGQAREFVAGRERLPAPVAPLPALAVSA